MGSPATCAMRDQRGLFAEVRCDIGAFEFNAGPALFASVTGKGVQRLQVSVLNQMGNPLVGWLVTFDPPNGLSIPFSASTVRTNDLGVAAISVDSSALSSEAILTVRSGSGTVWFRGSAAGFVPYYRDGLPNTGFAPGVRTFLPPQPAGKVYQAEPGLSLEIPKLSLSLPVVGIAKDGSNWDVSWLSRQAGYLEGTAFPSFQGNSVLTSHVYLADGTPGPFVHLASLIYGDKILVQAYGTTYTYEVRSVRSVSPGDTSVMAHKDAPWVTLLTCQDFDPASHSYLKRLAVSAVLVQSSTP
jgi:LPXTG-site transpeptidase (sortase) family protein